MVGISWTECLERSIVLTLNVSTHSLFSLFLCDFSSLSQFSYLRWQRARSGQALPVARFGPAMTHSLNPVSGWHMAKWPRSSGSDVSTAALVALPETDGSCEAANCSILGQDLLWLHFWHRLGKCWQMLKYTWKKLGGTNGLQFNRLQNGGTGIKYSCTHK